MSARVSKEEWDLALQRCGEEQIHLIGQIQSGFVLLGIELANRRFSYLSETAGVFLRTSLSALWSSSPDEFIDFHQLQILERRARAWAGRGARLVEVRISNQKPPHPAWIHLSNGHLIIEIESRETNVQDFPDAWDWEDLLRESLRRVEAAPDLPSKLEAVVENTARLGRFDRVMIYQFLADGTGEVVAERVREDWESYLGLRYPASDIPPQARQLFLKNDVRLIREVTSAPEALYSAADLASQPLDLSLSRFRQPSPIHLEYLKNMGVHSSFVTAVLSEGKLWGLISCHHGTPLNLPASRQVQLSALTNHLAIDLAGMAREIRLRNELACARISSQLIQCITVTDDWTSVLISMAGDLCEIMGADGLSLHFDGTRATFGLNPPIDSSLALIKQGLEEGNGLPYPFVRDPRGDSTDWMPTEIGGALVIPLSHFSDDALVFYRQERTRKVTWAGDPGKVVDRTDGVPRLKPRESFAAWQETVRGTSDPWTDENFVVAAVMRATLADIVITAHHFRQSIETPAAIRLRLAHESDPNPVVIADEHGIVVFQNTAAASDPILNHLQSVDLLVARITTVKSEIIESALHSLVHDGTEISLDLGGGLSLEANRLSDEERLIGYSIRVISR